VVKSQQCLKLRVFELRFLCFLKDASKNVKSLVFWIFKKRKKCILELWFTGMEKGAMEGRGRKRRGGAETEGRIGREVGAGTPIC